MGERKHDTSARIRDSSSHTQPFSNCKGIEGGEKRRGLKVTPPSLLPLTGRNRREEGEYRKSRVKYDILIQISGWGLLPAKQRNREKKEKISIQ